MGALAPVSPWLPEDDLLLKNSIEVILFSFLVISLLHIIFVLFCFHFILGTVGKSWFPLWCWFWVAFAAV